MYTPMHHLTLDYSSYTNYNLHIYTAWFPLFFPQLPLAPLAIPFFTPFVPLSTYLHPPAVTGIVLPLLRLLVN